MEIKTISSASLKKLDGLVLKSCSDATDSGLGLSLLAGLELLKVEVLFLGALKKIHFD